jgi:hypothetical protein
LLIATKSFDAHQVENRVDRADIGLLSEALVSIMQDFRRPILLRRGLWQHRTAANLNFGYFNPRFGDRDGLL